MNFDNLTDEQVKWLEGKIKEAYMEGWEDAPSVNVKWAEEINRDFSESLAKNQTCHILAERFMRGVDE